MIDKKITLGELKDLSTRHRKVEILKKTFVKLTCTDSWEVAQRRFPVHATEDHLIHFKDLEFKGSIPGPFKDYCSSALTANLHPNPTRKTVVTFFNSDITMHVMEGSKSTGEDTKQALPCSNGYNLVFAMLTDSMVNMTLYTYTVVQNVLCCVGDFKGKTVQTFVMCAHFPDVCTQTSALWMMGYFLFTRLLIIAQPKVHFQN